MGLGVLVLICLIGSSLYVKPIEFTTWKFIKFGQNPFCKKAGTDPGAFYSYEVSENGSAWVIGSDLSYEEVKYLMAYFGVKTPGELAGKSFLSRRSDIFSAIDYLVILQKHGGKYAPPSEAELYERVAQALSQMRCPDFSEVDRETVFLAFSRQWEGFSVNKAWLAGLRKRILALSNGQVWLLAEDRRKFSIRVKGPAEYLLLLRGSETQIFEDKAEGQRVIIGPYSQPVIFTD